MAHTSENTINNSFVEQSRYASAWTVKKGIKDAFPISISYAAVAFSLGIAAGKAGVTAFQAFLMSITNLSSSGQYAGILLYSEGAGYVELALMVLVANIRYLLMSCAISQKFAPGTGLLDRLLIAFGLSDEMFGLGIATPGYVRPAYQYAAICTAAPGWAIGTALGVIAGDIMPPVLSEAMNVAIFGMFIAIIIPPAKKDRHVLVAVAASFVLSLLAAHAPVLSGLSSGTRALVLTVIIASAIAVMFPVNDGEGSGGASGEPGGNNSDVNAAEARHE